MDAEYPQHLNVTRDATFAEISDVTYRDAAAREKLS